MTKSRDETKTMPNKGISSNNKLAPERELTVCDIMGEWGLYQWSICLFATLYSGLFGITVVVGPIWTPDLSHRCFENQTLYELDESSMLVGDNTAVAAAEIMNISRQQQPQSSSVHQCSMIVTNASENSRQEVSCDQFIYDDSQWGRVLTNSFDLVCERAWLKSFISSSALAGMLVSSITLGLISDKFGRLLCIKAGHLLALLATGVAALSHNYLLLNICIFVMSYAQAGAANALCTLLMEATSPKYRIIAVFEYGIGWGLGTMLIPALNYLTHDYRWFLATLFLIQLLMTPWLYWGIFESIRWLLSEGHINRAQIELRRACRMNRVQTSPKLAQDIAAIQMQQVRRASRVIDEQMAPARLAQALESDLEVATHELDTLSAAIKRSFGFDKSDDDADANADGGDNEGGNGTHNKDHEAVQVDQQDLLTNNNQLLLNSLSPTLARQSFSIETFNHIVPNPDVPPANQLQQRRSRVSISQKQLARIKASSPVDSSAQNGVQVANGNSSTPDGELGASRDSLTTQGLIQLAMKYSKTVEQQEEGGCFLVRMFHKKVWRETIILTLVSMMFETSYYGLVQANKFVGTNIDLNYVLGGMGEWAGAIVSTLLMVVMSRRSALVLPTFMASLACFGIALTYHLMPDNNQLVGGPLDTALNDLNNSSQTATPFMPNTYYEDEQTGVSDTYGSDKVIFDASNLPVAPQLATRRDDIELRHHINMYLMNVGKFTVSVGIQVAATIAMEAYPSNLRQTAPGAIIFVGRICSIVSPFLFNDTSETKWIFKSTLVSCAAMGLLVCMLAPFSLRDNKNKELCDHMNEIE